MFEIEDIEAEIKLLKQQIDDDEKEESLSDRWYHTGMDFYLNKHDYWEAERYFKMVKDEDPYYPRIDELLAEVRTNRLRQLPTSPAPVKPARKPNKMILAFAIVIVVFILGVIVYFTAINGVINIPGITPTETPICPHAGSDDTQTFIKMIELEAESALAEDLSLATSLYTKDATIRDYISDTTWNDVTEFYVSNYVNLDFDKLIIDDEKLVKKTEDTAWVTASSSGLLTFAESNEKVRFQGEPGSNHFIFMKDESGCWLISHYLISAQDEPFP